MPLSTSFILALDQGTTSSRAILFDRTGAAVAHAQQDFPQIYPQPGWVEHDPEEIWTSQLSTARKAIEKAGISPEQIAAIGIANQRETTIVWERETGRPVSNAIVWQCRRSAQICHCLREKGLSDLVRERTGLVLDPYFSATKLMWLFEHRPDLRLRAERGELAFGTVDSWLLFRLTGEHLTDVSNASRTLLFNIHSLQWDRDLLREFRIPGAILPTVKDSSGLFGHTKSELFGCAIPVAGIAGDQQAALFGHACFSPGDVKNTYGTGCFTLLNTGRKPVESAHNLLTTVAWRIGGETTYALEGSVFIAGAVVQWMRDELGLIHSAAESEKLALSVDDSGGVVVVPAFVGLGAPYWDSEARGTVFGLTRGTGRAQIVRAALESIAFQARDLIDAMVADYGRPIGALKADGGASANLFLMQFQADILGRRVALPAVAEITALGAASLAGLAVGYWADQTEIAAAWRCERSFEPALAEAARMALVERWHRAVQSTRDFAQKDGTSCEQ